MSKCVLCIFAFCICILMPPAQAQRPAGEAICRCPGMAKLLGRAANCDEACFGKTPASQSSNSAAGRSPSAGGTNPGADDEGARRARESAEAAAAAERQRQTEADLAERERMAEEKRLKDAEFVRNRDAAASTLKGSGGSGSTPGDGRLKGSVAASTGLKEVRGGEREVISVVVDTGEEAAPRARRKSSPSNP